LKLCVFWLQTHVLEFWIWILGKRKERQPNYQVNIVAD
jgi:hypothetical protein